MFKYSYLLIFLLLFSACDDENSNNDQLNIDSEQLISYWYFKELKDTSPVGEVEDFIFPSEIELVETNEAFLFVYSGSTYQEIETVWSFDNQTNRISIGEDNLYLSGIVSEVNSSELTIKSDEATIIYDKKTN